ncbi:MAG: ABC transporter permease [Alphaproteobacteria bacterium]|nr:MAG: ABC transporter permease [Alphaproteobacteria bacterium]
MRAQTRRRVQTGAVLSGPLLWTLLFLFVPYVIMFTYSFYEKKFPLFVPAFQFGNYLTVFTDPQYYQVLVRTAKIAFLVGLLSLLVAYPLTYFLVFKVRSPRLRSILYMAVIVPLWVSYLLRAYTWKTILGNEGILNSFLVWTGILDRPTDIFLYNQFSMVLTLTYIFIPFMVMPIYTALEKIPPSMVEASKDLGIGPLGTFARVTFPLSLPGVIAGFTFTFCLTFGDFVAPFLVGGPDGSMIANVVQSQFGAALNWPLGAALSIVMLAIVLTIISLSDRLERAGRLDLG